MREKQEEEERRRTSDSELRCSPGYRSDRRSCNPTPETATVTYICHLPSLYPTMSVRFSLPPSLSPYFSLSPHFSPISTYMVVSDSRPMRKTDEDASTEDENSRVEDRVARFVRLEIRASTTILDEDRAFFFFFVLAACNSTTMFHRDMRRSSVNHSRE